MKRASCQLLIFILLAGLPTVVSGEGEFEGSAEVVYRNVSVDGSERKYDEDFDGLDSGTRLGSLTANWLESDSSMVDFARLDLQGLGGEPYERSALRVGRKDIYDLSIRHTKQDYVYDLFELVPDEDGAAWDAERRRTDIDLRIHALDSVDLLFRFEDSRRSGSSLFMKDIERQLFRLETPLDQTAKRYTVGADFDLGAIDVTLRQTLRRYDNQFDNHTENDLGLEAGSLTTLDSYEWRQSDRGGSDWTTLRVSGSPGERVDFVVSLFGTFVGDEEIDSNVVLNAEGTTFTGAPFMVTNGTNRTRLEGDSTMIDAEVSIELASPLDLSLEYRSLDRNLEGESVEDLDGDGVPVLIDTQHDYEIETSTAVLEYRPLDRLGLRAGYRMIDRKLSRNGFLGVRNIDYQSGDDQTLVFGVNARPADWLRLNADYEDGDITQPFNAVAPQERDRKSVRASITPQSDMRIDLSFVDFENRNTAPDLRDPASTWDGSLEGDSWSASFWHKASDRVNYLFRYAVQDVESSVGVTFDQAGFGAVEDGDSIFNNDNQQFSGQLNVRCNDAWSGFLRVWMAESDGENILLGDGDPAAALAPGVRNLQAIDQEFANGEIGITRSFPSGIFVGATLRAFDYDDLNDLLDYDGEIFTIRAGSTF